jgi:glycosyltransferase involved in cell wall biosynthesis
MLLRLKRALRNRWRKPFSVITPTLNSGPKLEETINSVLSQDKGLFEYIIVDGCSTDETLNIIRKYGKRIKWISEKDRGVYDAMNKGIGMAKGHYLYFLGAGDHMRENILEKIEKIIPDEPLTFVYGNVYLAGGEVIYLGEFDEDKIAKWNICHQAIFYERTIFNVIGTYDLRYSLLADYAFNLKCFADKRIKRIYVDEVIADYEGGGLSTGIDINFMKDFRQE